MMAAFWVGFGLQASLASPWRWADWQAWWLSTPRPATAAGGIPSMIGRDLVLPHCSEGSQKPNPAHLRVSGLGERAVLLAGHMARPGKGGRSSGQEFLPQGLLNIPHQRPIHIFTQRRKGECPFIPGILMPSSFAENVAEHYARFI